MSEQDWAIREIPGILAIHEPPTGARTLPLVFDSPHSGRHYPEDFVHVPDRQVLRRAEDAFVDELFQGAPRHGAAFLKALFPRSYIDPNRDEHEIDSDMLAEPWPHAIEYSEKAEMGLGLIRRLIKGNQEIYDRPLSVLEVMRRIERCHRPYLDALSAMIERARRIHGAVWHVNCHSMKSHGRDRGRRISRADIVLGDLDGRSCDRDFTQAVAAILRARGYAVAINDPFKGAALVARFGRPVESSHSLQIEINRALYMEEEAIEKTGNFAALSTDIDHLIGQIAAFAADRLGTGG